MSKHTCERRRSVVSLGVLGGWGGSAWTIFWIEGGHSDIAPGDLGQHRI